MKTIGINIQTIFSIIFFNKIILFLTLIENYFMTILEYEKRGRLRPTDIKPLLSTDFNPAVIPLKGNTTAFLSRYVPIAAEVGEPDAGLLRQHIATHSPEGNYTLKKTDTIWSPEDSPTHLIEDVRARREQNGRIRLGATIVVDHTPYGAFATLEHEEAIPSAAEKFQLCKDLEGKNMTPIDDEGNFLFRREGEGHNHILTQLHYDEASHMMQEVGQLNFAPHIPGDSTFWGSWRIGTTFAPIRDGETEILIMHGIHTELVPVMQKNPDGIKYHYSMGQAALQVDEKGLRSVIAVDPNPLIVPEDFSSEDGTRLGKQLHPDLRVAIYVCGATERTDTQGETYVDIVVSYGDTTSFVVPFKKEELLARHRQLCEAGNK
jgi:hypothetical protein